MYPSSTVKARAPVAGLTPLCQARAGRRRFSPSLPVRLPHRSYDVDVAGTRVVCPPSHDSGLIARILAGDDGLCRVEVWNPRAKSWEPGDPEAVIASTTPPVTP